MRRKFTKHPVHASTDIRLSSADKDQILELAEDMLYQTWDNSPEYDLDEAYDSVVDHVIFVITEMDSDGDYSQAAKQYADYENIAFTSMIRQYVEEHYDDYRWYAE